MYKKTTWDANDLLKKNHLREDNGMEWNDLHV